MIYYLLEKEWKKFEIREKCQNKDSWPDRTFWSVCVTVTALLGDYVFLFSFSALQVQKSELFSVIQSMSGIGGPRSSVSLPNQTHRKNQNSDPRHTCLFLRALSRKSGPWESTHYLVTGRSHRWRW